MSNLNRFRGKRGLGLVLGVSAIGLLAAQQVGAGDMANYGNGLQIAGTLAGAAEQPELSIILNGIGQMMAEDDSAGSPDPTVAIEREIQQINQHLGVIDRDIDDLVQANNLNVTQTAVQWNRAMIEDDRSVGERVDHILDTSLRPMSSPPLSDQADVMVVGMTSRYQNSFHLQAHGAANSALEEAGAFLSLGFLTQGGCGDALPVRCSQVNQRWVSEAVAYIPHADMNPNGTRHSYAEVPSNELETTYELQPTVGMGAYFAALLTAVHAMEVDMGHRDMAQSTDPMTHAYFSRTYAHAFDRHIAFFSYDLAPDDPGPDGLGDTDFTRYYSHTDRSLSDSYRAGLHFKRAGFELRGWEDIDKMRSLLIYAEAHGTRRGWHYVRPAYIADVLGAGTGSDHVTKRPEGGPAPSAGASSAGMKSGMEASSAASTSSASPNATMHPANACALLRTCPKQKNVIK